MEEQIFLSCSILMSPLRWQHAWGQFESIKSLMMGYGKESLACAGKGVSYFSDMAAQCFPIYQKIGLRCSVAKRLSLSRRPRHCRHCVGL